MPTDGTAVKDDQVDSATRIPADQARTALGELLDRAWDGEDIAITRNTRERAVLIGWREYVRLRDMEREVKAKMNARTRVGRADAGAR